ncbi:MAG: DegT/DnrJ/EryC1/StrS family aminotransferase [Planctomycetes bacterium]|nr:DegT/DnrJ/EryC1/StrS family aminotransferase [Planctomycetota bacterium]NUQ33942.1 DegT/DnrJ/EryC1/StrS family aminotransferase [Planctomycetaceae bacterium]
MNIPLVNLEAQHAPLRAEIAEAIKQVLVECSFVRGPAVKNFQAEAAKYLGVKHAIGCANGSDALVVALMALGVGPGDEVVTVPHTYVATPEAIRRVGAKIIFCDVEPVGWTMDPAKLKKLVTPRTKAIMPVHIFGQCALHEELVKAAGNIPIVEDAAQAWGATRNGKHAGALGAIATFSFYPTKTLGACGDGGMLATNDDRLAELIQSVCLHGESKDRYYNDRAGMNSRLDSVQAAILRIKLKHVDAWNTKRDAIARYYQERFEESPIKAPKVLPGNTHVWHQYCIMTPERDALAAHLKSKGVATGVYYPIPQHLQRCFKDLGHKAGDFPVTESISSDSLSIPCWPEMSEEQQAYVADEILAFAGAKANK